MKKQNECDCCGWDDCGHTHEPYCSSLTHLPIDINRQWEDAVRKIIESWKYERGDDVLASALADAVIAVFKEVLHTAKKEERNALRRWMNGKQVTKEKVREYLNKFEEVV